MPYTGHADTFHAALALLLDGLTAGGWEVPLLPASLLCLTRRCCLLALAGILAYYAISAHGRQLDLAPVSIAGTEMKQLFAITALDGLITAATAAFISIAASATITAAFAAGMYKAFRPVGYALPVKQWLAVLAVLALVLTLCTWLTVRKSVKRPPTALVTRYNGE